MKPLNARELKEAVAWMQPQILGAQLQGVSSDGEAVYLELFGKGEVGLIIDLRPGHPFFVLLREDHWPNFKKQAKPVSLFLNSHGKNLFLESVEVDPEKGRVVHLHFRNRNQECDVEVVLIPRMSNLIVRAGGKSVAWNKPREISGGTEAEFDSRIEDWNDWGRAYLQWRFARQENNPPIKKALSQLERDIAKKKSAVSKIQSSLSTTEEERWRAFGEQLKMVQEPPSEFADLWDEHLNLRDNRDRAFRKAKDLAKKRTGAEARVGILLEEIGRLEKKLADPGELEAPATGLGTQMLQKTDSRGRTLHLPSGAQAIIGKSAKDNLALLRQARAWDLWIHLKDEPSAHALIFRNKNQRISPAEIETVASWMITQSLKKKPALPGLKFDVIIVECRFVRPIKGDRLGRVTYQSPTTVTIAYRKS